MFKLPYANPALKKLEHNLKRKEYLKMHYHPLDALRGFVLGVATGFAVSYAMARLWNQIPLTYHIVMISVFVTLVFPYSQESREG